MTRQSRAVSVTASERVRDLIGRVAAGYPHSRTRHYPGHRNLSRCPRGHPLSRHPRDYVCRDCGACFGPCRCFLFDHVVSLSGRGEHRPVYPILGGGYRVTYKKERLAR